MKSPQQLATVLALFSAQRPVCAADDLCEALDCSRATGYRHLKALVDEGWLSKVGAGRYALGLRIAQLHGVLIDSHPLLRAAQPVLQALAPTIPWCLSLTCQHGSDQLLDVLYTAPDAPQLQHGRTRTQWASAAGALWLASLPEAEQALHYRRHAAAFGAQSWGRSWADAQAHLQTLAGGAACSTWQATATSHVLGVAVPVHSPEGQLVATLSAEAPQGHLALPTEALPALHQQLHDAAWSIRKAPTPLAAEHGAARGDTRF